MGIEWRESLSIGVEAIDNQHKELLLRFDKLLNACQECKGSAELEVMLPFLEEYVHIHFNDEEALQKLHRYPDYETHRAEHVYFIEQLKKLKADVEKEGITTNQVIATNNMLLKWLINHISKVDTKLGAFIRAETP